MKYLRLLRVFDQYVPVGFAIIAGIYLQNQQVWIFWWAIALLFLSCAVIIPNELIDRDDVDRHSWNTVHILRQDLFSVPVLVSLFFLFTLIGLALSYIIGLFYWAGVAYILALLYSLKPFRLKTRFGFDIGIQVVCTFLIPFLGPFWKLHALGDIWPLVYVLACWVFVGFFTYQFTDYEADKKAGFRCMHVVLGVRRSLWLGLMVSVLGILLFFFFSWLWSIPLVWIFVAMAGAMSWFYVWLLTLRSEKKQLSQLQVFVRYSKIGTQVLLPVFFIWWLVI